MTLTPTIERALKGEPLHCSECGSLVRTYERKLTSALAACLAILYRVTGGVADHFIRTRDIQDPLFHKNGGERALLRHWGFVTIDKAGRWALTQRGFDFVNGRISAPRAIIMFQRMPINQSTDLITFSEAVKSKFNLDDLLRRRVAS